MPQPEDVLSFKRYFMNNLDSYHSEYFIKLITKLLEEKTAADEANRPPPVIDLGEDAEPPPPPPPLEPYELIGTVKDVSIDKIDGVARFIPPKKLLPQLLTCGTVILDISSDRDQVPIVIDYLKLLKDLLERQEVALAALQEAGDSVPIERRILILISTVMTWAATKPLDPDTPDMPFVETDFRKRKSHPNYKGHLDAENFVIELARKYKKQIGRGSINNLWILRLKSPPKLWHLSRPGTAKEMAIVVTAGLTYGGKEDILYYWFQKAWENEPILPIFGRGTNVIPIINIVDLAQILYNLLADFPKKLYILAVEQTPIKQREIIKSLGRSMGSGLFKCIPQEKAFLIKEIEQRVYDLMCLNLIMEPTFIVETMGLQWTSESTFAENVSVLIKQFKKDRNLKAFKILVYGPPIVGKTTLSKRIADSYGLVYISPETVVEDLLKELTFRVNHWDVGETADLPMLGEDEPADEDEIADGEEEAVQETARQTLALLTSGRPVTDEELYGFIRQKLLSKEAQNKGWVLDGFPTSLELCDTIFEKGEDADVEEDEGDEDQFEEDLNLYENVLKKILPDLVVSLQATNEFLCEKAMHQPEGDPRMEEETVFKRLISFRLNDTIETTTLNFFDELSIHPFVLEVINHRDYAMDIPYKEVTLRMGSPCRYPKLLSMIEAAEKKAKQEADELIRQEEKQKQELEAKLKRDKEDKMEYWSQLYAVIREEEEAALAVAGEPMRNYLMYHIFPTLTPGLLEVAKVRPQDPVDFLAEYLFKLNPSGKMLEPGFNLKQERLLGRIKLLDDSLQELDIEIDPLLPPEVDYSDTASV